MLLIAIDTETTELNLNPGDFKYEGTGYPRLLKLRLGWCISNDGEGYRDTFYFTDKQSFWDYIYKQAGQFDEIWVVAHNMDFDANVLGIYNEVERGKFTYEKPPILSSGRYSWDLEYEGSNITFIDEISFLGGFIPLEKIGRDMGLFKGDVDRGNIDELDEETVKEYCYRDTEIVEKYMLTWFEFIKKHNCGKPGKTIASQCLSKFIEMNGGIDWKEDRIFLQLNPVKRGINRWGTSCIKIGKIYTHNNPKHLINFERSCYHGGWVECFYTGKVNNKIYKLDVNSFHPYIMRNFKLPHLPKRVNVEGYFNLYDAVIKTEKPLIPIKENVLKGQGETLIFPVGEYRCQFCSPEKDRLIEMGGKIVKIFRQQPYRADILFKEYIDEFYQLKEQYTREGNKTMRSMSKYFMNSLEGKFAQHIKYLKKIKKSTHSCNLRNDKYSNTLVISGQTYGEENYTEGRLNFIPISVGIRAWTRVLMSRWMELVERGGGHTYYVDTDSLFVDETGYKVLEQAGMIHETELGKLAVEGISDQPSTFLAPKNYIFAGKKTHKGIKARAKQISNSTYKQDKFLRSKDLLRHSKLKDGVILIKGTKVTSKDRNLKRIGKGWNSPHKIIYDYENDKNILLSSKKVSSIKGENETLEKWM